MKFTLFFFFQFMLLSSFGQIQKLAPLAFKNALKEQVSQLQLFDMRDDVAFSKGHIKKAVQMNYEAEDFDEKIQATFIKDVPVFIYCFTGEKSAEAAVFLHELGYKKVIELQGGFANWTSSSLPYVSSSKAIEPVAAFTSKDFERIISSHEVVLVDFYASWCGPCKKLDPILTKLEKEEKNVHFLRFDADVNELIVKGLNISEIPTLILYKFGKQVWKTTGIITEKQLKEILGRYVL